MGSFTLHSDAKNRPRRATGSSGASVSPSCFPPWGHRRLRRGARGSETPCSGMATQEAARQPRGPQGHQGLPTRAGSSPSFRTNSVFQQTLVRFAGGAKPIPKHPASAQPGSSAAFSGLSPSPPSPQRTNPTEVALCLAEGI